jgi:uncharacterized protein
MITLDTSAIFSLINRRDKDHQRVVQTLQSVAPPYVIATGTLSEIAYLLEQRLGQHVLLQFLADIQSGAFKLDQDTNFARVHQLVSKYADLPLGLSDALVIECAERRGRAVLTLDSHFWIVAKEGAIQVMP